MRRIVALALLAVLVVVGCEDDGSGVSVTAEVIGTDLAVSAEASELRPHEDGIGYEQEIRITWDDDSQVALREVRFPWFAPIDGTALRYPVSQFNRFMPPFPSDTDTGLLIAGPGCWWYFASEARPMGLECSFIGHEYQVGPGDSATYVLQLIFFGPEGATQPLPGTYVIEEPVRWDRRDIPHRTGGRHGTFTIRVTYEVRE